MKLESAIKQVETFYDSIKTIHPELRYEVVDTWGGPFKKWFRNEVPANDYSKKSGVYLFSSKENEILYIGKASSDNFGAEIYGKFGAATKVDNNDLPYFGNSSMAKWAPEEYQETIKSGDIYISALAVEPKDFTSLFEVYLHIWCSIIERLPRLNRRIG